MAAWEKYYRYGLKGDPGTPLAYGIVALKKELDSNGFGKGLVLNTPYFGDAMRNRTKEFQAARNLTVDGVIGPATALELFRWRVKLELLPEDLLGKLIKLESGYDPAAVGTVDKRDRGLCQINSSAHPDVSDEEAFEPAFSIPWAARYLRKNYNLMGDWNGAIASYNMGFFYADKWVEAGLPASGLFTSTGRDYALLCTNYVSVVRKQVY